MKKQFLTAILLLLGTHICASQIILSEKYKKTQFGIYGQISHYQPNDGFLGESYAAYDYGIKKMYTLGFSGKHIFSRHVALWAGAGLTYKRYNGFGVMIIDTTHPGYTPPSEGLNCFLFYQEVLYCNNRSLILDIPLMIQYSPFKSPFFIGAGAELNVKFYNSQKSANKSYDGTITQKEYSGWGDEYNLMIPLSVGVNLPLKHGKALSIEPGIKASLGLNNYLGSEVGFYTLRTSFYF